MPIPLQRLHPWFPGQMGVSQSDVSLGLRSAPTSIVLFVDKNHPGATVDNDGTDPEYPLTTVAQALTNLIAFATATSSSLEGSVIVIGAGATIAETVIIPPTAPANCTIMGAGGGIDAPTWAAATAAGTALTVRQSGWTIEGIHFNTGAAGTAMLLQWVPGSSYIGNRTVIQNCVFEGLWGGLYGINLSGAPYDTRILNNEFREYRRADSSAAAIIVTDSTEANPYMNYIVGNAFWENENHVTSLDGTRGFNLSIITDNVFHDGVLIAATDILDLRGGSRGENIVTRNVFAGDYSNTGGYYANVANPGMWIGNIAEDIAEGEVGDNGFTIAIPAA